MVLKDPNLGQAQGFLRRVTTTSKVNLCLTRKPKIMMGLVLEIANLIVVVVLELVSLLDLLVVRSMFERE